MQDAFSGIATLGHGAGYPRDTLYMKGGTNGMAKVVAFDAFQAVKTPLTVLHDLEFATGGSAGNQIERGFFVLQETRTRL